jgi:hypothetical protein
MFSHRSDTVTSFDASTIDDQTPFDPSLMGGFDLAYEHKVLLINFRF